MQRSSTSFEDVLSDMLGRWGIEISADQLAGLRGHYEAMLESNRVMNLTRITDPVEAAIKHYADSLFLLVWVGEQQAAVRTVLDLGTGAGLPAMPLAIMRPEWTVTAIDATGKKVDFLARAASILNVGNLRAEHAHSEHWKTEQRFDLVLAKALGPLERCLALGAKFLAPAGRVIAYKTRSQADVEHTAARDPARRLRLKHEGSYGYQLFLEGETLERALVVYRREKQRTRPRGRLARSR